MRAPNTPSPSAKWCNLFPVIGGALICIALVGGHPVHAQTTRDGTEAQTQSGMNAAAARDFEVADEALNAAWASAKSFADAIGQGQALLEAQRQWLAYRDAACTVQASPFAGGSIQPMALSNCLTKVTEDRTAMLLEFHGY